MTDHVPFGIPEQPMRGAVNKTSDADIDRAMMDNSEMYVQGRFAQMILQDVGSNSRAFYDAAQLRAAFRAGYDYANQTAAPAPQPQPEVGAEPVAWPSSASPLPWKYGRLDEADIDWIEDANGMIFVEHVGSIDGPAICAAVNAFATPPVVEEAVKAEGLDAETLERRLHLWFFRDVSDDQRHGLFKLCGYPVDEIGMRHSLQQRCLQHLVSAIRARSATP